jgi:hypothetical protein
VADDNLFINYIYTGWPGCIHDNRAWRNSKLYQREEYWGDSEYLLGDSAFSSTRYVIPAFKCMPNQTLSRRQEFFNTKLASARIRVEHCIGVLKNRFPILRQMNIDIREEKDIRTVAKITLACAILHNMLLNENIPQDWYNNLYDRIDDDFPELDRNNDEGERKRNQVLDFICDKFNFV